MPKRNLNFPLTLNSDIFIQNKMEELQKEISDLKHQLAEKNSRIEVLENRLLAYERVECIKVQGCIFS